MSDPFEAEKQEEQNSITSEKERANASDSLIDTANIPSQNRNAQSRIESRARECASADNVLNIWYLNLEFVSDFEIRYSDLYLMLLNRRRLLTDRKRLGRWGEKRCETFLKRKGLKKLARNFSCKTGELDLVMVDTDRSIVFIEVKARADESLTPAESVVTPAKKAKLVRTARYFLATNKIDDRPFRFDIVTIILGQSGQPQIRHYQNAFVP
jgi:putative endonuclease